MRGLIWFLAGAIALIIVVCGGRLIFLKTHANGFSARAQPSVLESWAARQARAMPLPPVLEITRTLAYDKLIIATGAKPLTPDIPGIEHVHPLHTMADSFKVHERVTSGKVRRAAVVGVGYIGVEMADALTHRGIEVELVGRSGSILPTVDPEIGAVIRDQLESRNVRVVTGIEIERIRRTDDGLALDGTGEFASTVDLIVWATGVSPAIRCCSLGRH
jgi:pyruvate/2-oxoglutarate dehydrogenase complex dihydrolipoamide dehydrogenase (E3) component